MTEYERIPGKQAYPTWWEYVGCGYCPYRIEGPFVQGRDDSAFNVARATTQEHVKAEHAAAKAARKENENGAS